MTKHIDPAKYRGVISLGTYIGNHPWLYYLLMCTWGLPFTLLGLLMSLVYLLTFHKPHKYKNSYYFVSHFKGGWGFELGNCFVVSKDIHAKYIHSEWNMLYSHEYGHTVENCIYGPAMLLLALTSTIRYWYRELRYFRRGLEPKTWYDDYWYEFVATNIGAKL